MNNKILYSDSVIEVAILVDNENESLKSIALKYIKPKDFKDKKGETVFMTNAMGGETDWFILPYTFGAAIGKKLFEQFNAGLEGFNKIEVDVLKKWLIEMEIIDVVMCY